MNKKVIILFTLITCCLLIIVVSIFGSLNMDTYRTSVEKIEFIDPTNENGECRLTANGEKIIGIERGTKQYQVSYKITPIDATDQTVDLFLLCDPSVATIDGNGVITFYKEVTITVQIVSNYLDYKMDYLMIEFVGDIQSDITENPF
jgi:hypothetical protein